MHYKNVIAMYIYFISCKKSEEKFVSLISSLALLARPPTRSSMVVTEPPTRSPTSVTRPPIRSSMIFIEGLMVIWVKIKCMIILVFLMYIYVILNIFLLITKLAIFIAFIVRYTYPYIRYFISK